MSHVLFEHGADGVVVGDGWVAAYFATAVPWQERLSAIETTVATMNSDGAWGECRVESEVVDDEDWTSNWRRHFRPFRVGERLVIVPAWEDFTAGPGDLLLRIDPAMAFGSGEHATTHMALTMLEELVEKDMTVIDVGTGSGILAIAAGRLGAGRVWAVDIDEAAVTAACANVRANGMDDIIHVQQGSIADLDVGPVDVIIANIVAGTIIKLAPQLAERLRSTGWLVVGGIIEKRQGDVASALENAGLTIVQVLQKEDWITMCATPGEGILWQEDSHASYLCPPRGASR